MMVWNKLLNYCDSSGGKLGLYIMGSKTGAGRSELPPVQIARYENSSGQEVASRDWFGATLGLAGLSLRF
jgi:hypothetical protein